MMKPTRLVVTAAALAALAATGATSASAASGTSPAPGTTKTGTVKVGSKSNPDADLAALAAKLGVTTDRLTAALSAAKMSLASSDAVTPDAFVAAVAANLGLPTAVVHDALIPMFIKPMRFGGDPKKDGAKKDTDDEQNSPLTSDAAAAALATALGVDQAKAKKALADLVTLASRTRGIDPASKSFEDIAAALGVTAEQLKNALSQLKQSLDHA